MSISYHDIDRLREDIREQTAVQERIADALARIADVVAPPLVTMVTTFSEPAVCDTCNAPKGAQVIGQACNNNCGGRVVRKK